jgi:hypothetical protein
MAKTAEFLQVWKQTAAHKTDEVQQEPVSG